MRDKLAFLALAAAVLLPACASNYAGSTYKVRFETTAGNFVVQVHPKWAPRGAKRFKELVKDHFYDGNRFFRVVPGFVVQWGMNGDPAVQAKWQDATFPDDPVVRHNTEGTIVFAKTGAPDSRTTQLFINLGDNTASLDQRGFAAFGEVVEGMDNVRKISSKWGQAPDQNEILKRGNAYLDKYFHGLDFIRRAYLVK